MQYSRAYYDHIFEMWAVWVHQGSIVATSSTSILGLLIENQGVTFYGSGNGAPCVDCIEADVEAALVSLSMINPLSANVFRLEYCAIGNQQDDTQIKKAHRLNIALRSYRYQLSLAKKFVIKKLELKK